MNQHSSNAVAPVEDGRIRVENFAFMKSLPPRVFKFLRIDANDNCNLKCTYCRIPRSSSLIDPNELEQFLNEKVISVQSLQFGCGMEPTIDSRLTDIMLMAASTPAKPSVRYILQTNGTKLHKHDHAKMLRAGLTRLSVSIDSLDEEVHAAQRGGSSIKQVIQNLEEFRRNCPAVDIQIICVVTKASIAGCEQVAEFAIQLGVTRFAFREMMHVDNDPVADPVKVAPLIVPPGEFEAMTERVSARYLNQGTEFVFLPINQLHQNRFNMRKNAFPINEQGHWQRSRLTLHPNDNYQMAADKSVLTPVIEHDADADLLAGKEFFALRGFAKSGTTWAGRILNLHPEISCAGEFNWQNVAQPFLQNLAASYLFTQKAGLRDVMSQRLDRMIKECMVLANHPDAHWVGDRTPVRIDPGVICDGKFIHLIRDGRDVLISRAHQFFSHSRMYPQLDSMPEIQRRRQAFKEDTQFFLKNPDELLDNLDFVRMTAQGWATEVLANQSELESLDPSRWVEIRYESLHKDAERTRRKLYDFFDVDPGLAGPLAFNTLPGFEKESPDSFLRKGIVGDWKHYMTARAKAAFNEEAGEALVQLGYTESTNW